MNPLTLVPAKVRLWAYLAYGSVAMVVSSIAVYYTAVGATDPKWVGGAAAVLGTLAGPFGAVAGSNVNKDAPKAKPDLLPELKTASLVAEDPKDPAA